MTKKIGKIGKQPVPTEYVAAIHQQMQILTARCGELVEKMREMGVESVTVEGKEGSETFLKRMSGFLSNIQRELDMPISLLSQPSQPQPKPKRKKAAPKGTDRK